MKNKFIQIFSLFLTLGFLTSCHTESDNETNLYSGDSYISFGTVSTLSALENSTSPVTLTAYASVPNITSDISVDFTITPDNASASDYSVVGNKTSFTFGPGKYTDEIQILPVNNFDEDGNKILNITLSSTSSEHTLGFPGPDSNGKTIVVTFLDDDCAFTYQEIGDATWSGQDTVPATQAGPNESQITTSYDGTNLLIEGIGYPWITDTAYWDEVVIVSHKLIATIDAQTGVVTIVEQPMCTTTWNGNQQPDYTLSATGIYVSCAETMTLNYNIYQGGNTTPLRSFSETITIN